MPPAPGSLPRTSWMPSAEASEATAEEVARALGVDPARGLSGDEAERRLRAHGENRLREPERASAWLVLGRQFRGAVTALLAGAAVVAFLLQDVLEAIAIALVLAVNGAIGFATELRATRSMEALQGLVTVPARVRRDGAVRTIDAGVLVPGDVVLLEAGDVVPADVRLARVARFETDESALTGESVPAVKHAEALPSASVLAERQNMAFSATAVTRGTAEGIVVTTGRETELGRIAELVAEAHESRTPLELRLDALGKRLMLLVLALAIVLAIVGVARGRDLVAMAEISVALAVAAIPEGLPIMATLALARGVLRMARRNALVNRLAAVETLGGVGVVCVDKTGTLTQNEMHVARLETTDEARDLPATAPPGAVSRAALEVAALCNNAVLGDTAGADPMERALLTAAVEAGIDVDALAARNPRVREEPFDAHTKRMATLHEGSDGTFVAVKGAPEVVLPACARVLRASEGEPGGTRVEALDATARDGWLARNERMARAGLRVIALARREGGALDGGDLTLLALVGLRDPPRVDAAGAVAALQGAGVRVVMITGDQPATAGAIARAVGLVAEGAEPRVLHGRDLMRLAEMSAEDRERARGATIVARATPEQKLDLVALHQGAGHLVGMTGDGVNDAPALQKADIGVAMGQRGTQVAKEAADVVLQDDSLSTIAAAVEEGRIIFGNIRKAIVYLLSCNVSEILVVGVGALLSAPLPLLPLQVLVLNLVTDVLPALAIATGGADENVMRRPPRPASEPLVGRREWRDVAVYGSFLTLATLGAFAIALGPLQADTTTAVTISFLTLALTQLWHVVNMRGGGSWRADRAVMRNPRVWGALAICIGILAALVYVEPLASVLELRPLDAIGYATVLGMSLTPVALGQAWRLGGRSGAR